MGRGTMSVVVLFACSAVALAGESYQDQLESAKASAGGGDVLAAASAFGRAAAATHSDGDLLGEHAVAEELARFLRGLRPRSIAADETNDEPDQIDAVLALMAELDARRLAAYVSVQPLAMVVIEHAVRTGEPRGLDAAAEALAAQAKAKRCGDGTKTRAAFATGLVESSDAAPLEEVYATCEKEGWGRLGGIVAVEVAARHLATGDVDAAREVLLSATDLVSVDQPNCSVLQQDLRQLAGKRLADAPEELRSALAGLFGPMSVSAKGGKGGAGGAGGAGGRSADPTSPIGEAWPRLASSKPFVTVRRVDTTYVVKYSCGKAKVPATEAEVDHVEHVERGGGIMVWLAGPQVALCMVDHTGLKGTPGGSSQINRFRAWYLLADKETWGVAKNGQATVR